MREYDWLQYQLSWFEKAPSEAFVGEAVLLWPSRTTLLDEGLILPHQNCTEGTLPVTAKHLHWLSAQVPVPVDLQRYDYFVEALGCWSST
jgi:hypothetical protein